MPKTANIKIGDNTYSLPLFEGVEQEKAIDISKLRSQANVITLDPGYKNTGSATSAITYLDGEKGILRYRGYPIEQLAEQSSFIEVAYLVIFGELPSKEQLSTFSDDIKHHTLIHEDVRKILDGFPSTAHPMGVLASLFCSQTAFYPESLNANRANESVYMSIVRSIAKMPTFAAWSYKNAMGHPLNYPDNNLEYCSRFIKMMFSMPGESYTVDPLVASTLDKLFILHADHEQNCSASTVRMVGSSQASIYSSISAGINALWGPLHGGANQAVITMLSDILQGGNNVDKWIEKAKDKNDPFRLMGFGHRVYKNFDPRAKIIKKATGEVLNKLNTQDPMLDIAKKLEEVALNDSYFIEKKLYPNVDFYSGVIYRAMGIPIEMFTVMFALGRLPGWIAQWKEMLENKEPIGRPRQIYTGKLQRDYIPLNNR